MSLREEFVALARRPEANKRQLCRRFGISPKTGYKWLGRAADGERSPLDESPLADRSRRPKRSPRRSSDEVEQAVIAIREQHPAWGGRKIRRVLQTRRELESLEQPLPAASTIGQILRRHGLIDPEESAKHRRFVRFEHPQPNDLWQMDFKGHFEMDDGGRCHPLTVLDDHSRYSLGLRACGDERGDTVQPILIELFERFGQPRRILCDNGGPWGNCSGDGAERYTLLEVWLLLHGIAVSHGRPYHPQTQGKDERFHRTLNVELLRQRTLRDLSDAQEQFDQWRDVYNQVRPHEALGMEPPITRYRPSERSYQPDPPPPQYDTNVAVRKVSDNGTISYRNCLFRVGKAFVGQRVGLRPSETDGILSVLLGEHEIGQLNLHQGHPASVAPGMAGPPVAALPSCRPCPEQSVTHVSEQVLPLTPA